jgi:hypothetical protein
MNLIAVIGTSAVTDMGEWRDRLAAAQDQAEVEDAAQTVVWAIVLAFASIIVGSLIFAVLP